jgi:DNA-binding CsgD family transcriptional regulator
VTVPSSSARPGTAATDRELEVLAAWRDLGGDVDEVARELGITRNTVKAHIANARARTNSRRTWQAVLELLGSYPLG